MRRRNQSELCPSLAFTVCVRSHWCVCVGVDQEPLLFLCSPFYTFFSHLCQQRQTTTTKTHTRTHARTHVGASITLSLSLSLLVPFVVSHPFSFCYARRCVSVGTSHRRRGGAHFRRCPLFYALVSLSSFFLCSMARVHDEGRWGDGG